MATDNYEIRKGSLEYLPIKVTAFKLGAAYDPTSDPVQIALPIINTDPSVFKNATWQTVGSDSVAEILIGPGGDFELDLGDYDIIIKITDNPEIPVLRAGRLSII
jgi:hypothetical protein